MRIDLNAATDQLRPAKQCLYGNVLIRGMSVPSSGDNHVTTTQDACRGATASHFSRIPSGPAVGHNMVLSLPGILGFAQDPARPVSHGRYILIDRLTSHAH